MKKELITRHRCSLTDHSPKLEKMVTDLMREVSRRGKKWQR